MKKLSHLLALLIALEVLSIALYLGRAGQFGFPLDDAWIHQTYARSLGLQGVMAFSPGIPSTGSTSFGWTLLLAMGYFLKVPFFLWTYLLGGIFAVATAFIAARLSQEYFGDFRNAVIVGVVSILEWHLAWAAVSGMEIGLFTCLTLLFFLLLKRGASSLLLGFLTGLIILVRPEGVILVMVYGLNLMINHRHEMKGVLRSAAAFLLVSMIVISPWVAFNLAYSQQPFPSTITAKFIQYTYPWSVWKSLKYLWEVVIYFGNGPLLLLLPGAGLISYQAIRTRNALLLAPLLWSFSLIGLYALALPAIYDQGRYIMPLLPWVIIYGVAGLDQLLDTILHTPRIRSAVWMLFFAMVLLLWFNGAADFSFRTRLFSNVHMQAAQWINTHTSQDVVLATHDVGIIGYYTERQIVDLAGLVTPEILPMIRDQKKLVNYLREKDVTYLIVYSGYYRELLNSLDTHVVFSPGAEQLRAMGVEPFEIHKVAR